MSELLLELRNMSHKSTLFNKIDSTELTQLWELQMENSYLNYLSIMEKLPTIVQI